MCRVSRSKISFQKILFVWPGASFLGNTNTTSRNYNLGAEMGNVGWGGRRKTKLFQRRIGDQQSSKTFLINLKLVQAS